MRTAARVAPCAPFPAPNSSAANVIVWEMSVPRYPATIEIVQRRARTRAARASMRDGGDHHGNPCGPLLDRPADRRTDHPPPARRGQRVLGRLDDGVLRRRVAVSAVAVAAAATVEVRGGTR